MEKNLKHISKDIRNGKLLEENIPRLFNQLANHYNTYAEIRLTLHYFAFYEAFCDEEGTWSKEALEITNRLNVIIREDILQSQSGLNREEVIRTVDDIRKDITKRMEVLTAFTDIFQTYEYILNRIEYRFKGEVVPFDEDEFSKEVLRYIFDSEDNFIINEKIKEIIGQLPIRITKQKYFELLKGSFQAYLGAEESSLEAFLYMIRTSAMLYNEEGMEALYPALWEKKELLSHMEFKDITIDNYDKSLSILHAATLTLEMETTVYFSLQEIINEVYSILLCSPYAGMVASEEKVSEEAAISIICEINGLFIKNIRNELPSELVEKFTGVEGVQEEMSFEISTMEDALYEVKNQHKQLTRSLMLDQFLQVLLRSQNLLSGSLFINLEEDKISDEIVDEDRVVKEMKALEEELSDLFDTHDRMVSRAVIANTINKMPVFFTNHKEVMDYVRYSLERCSDVYEKAACFEIINDIMKAE